MSYQPQNWTRRQLFRTAGFTAFGLAIAPTALAACGSSGDGSGSASSFKVALTSFGTAEGFDPLKNPAISATAFHALVYDWMAGTDPTTAAATPGVVETFTQSSDGLSWDLKLRSGLKFHDGSAATSADLLYSLQLATSKDAARQDLAQAVASMAVADNLTVRVKVNKVYPYFQYMFTNVPPNLGILVSQAYFEKVGHDAASKKPVGVGPWKFVSGTIGDSYNYDRNTDYWGPAPAFDKLTTLQVPDAATQLAMLKSGQADLVSVGLSDLSDVQAQYSTAPGFAPQVRFDIAGTYDPRAKGMPTTDIRVREAMFRAIDYATIAKNAFYGKALQRLPPRALVGIPEIDDNKWSSYIDQLTAFDPAKAKALLAAAGYADGFDIKVAVWDSGLGEKNLAQTVQSMWKDVGIRAELALLNNSQYDQTQGPADEWVGQVIWGATRVFGLASNNMSWVWGHTGGQAVACDVTDKSNPKIFLKELDDLVYQGQTEPDPAKRKQIIDQYIKIGLDTYTSYTFGQVPQYMALSKGWKFVNLPKAPTAYQLTYFTPWVAKG